METSAPASFVAPAPAAAGGPGPADPLPSGAAGASRPVLNYFYEPAAAVRYAAHRPRGQARVLALVAETLHNVLPVERALDVGCGTGHSTVTLLPYARQIVGLDPSSMMLAQAGAHPRIIYLKGHAEALPLQRESFDLVTVSSAYHWFDHHGFLQEAARVLRPGGWLVLYKAGSLGLATGQPEFARWRREALRVRYPKVARNHEVLTPDVAAQFGFSEVRAETTAFAQVHRLDDYVENLLTHSSVIRVVDGGRETPRPRARGSARPSRPSLPPARRSSPTR